ncbi:hypothetical protein EYF80_059208 [Liparis tanakae]|uniref:Uncharacterized protein n=1 Tax=Liparis tanakae TaxID=230148 RepID=A0A4Z2EPD7_9TELE|nr:hypothetical protein EYF80_059208 [Liparis tanakae]
MELKAALIIRAAPLIPAASRSPEEASAPSRRRGLGEADLLAPRRSIHHGHFGSLNLRRAAGAPSSAADGRFS